MTSQKAKSRIEHVNLSLQGKQKKRSTGLTFIISREFADEMGKLLLLEQK